MNHNKVDRTSDFRTNTCTLGWWSILGNATNFVVVSHELINVMFKKQMSSTYNVDGVAMPCLKAGRSVLAVSDYPPPHPLPSIVVRSYVNTVQ